MIPRRSAAVMVLLGLALPSITENRIAAQAPLGSGRVWIGPPANPERYYRFATDNGIPGTGRYAYFDYNWPSLRQAIDRYGLFGRRMRARRGKVVVVPVVPGEAIRGRAAPIKEEPTLLKPPRKLGD